MQMADAAAAAAAAAATPIAAAIIPHPSLEQHIDKLTTICAWSDCPHHERSKPIYKVWHPQLYCGGCGRVFCCTGCCEAHTAGGGQCPGPFANTLKGKGYTKQAWEEAAGWSRVSLTSLVTMAHIKAGCYTCLHNVCVHSYRLAFGLHCILPLSTRVQEALNAQKLQLKKRPRMGEDQLQQLAAVCVQVCVPSLTFFPSVGVQDYRCAMRSNAPKKSHK